MIDDSKTFIINRLQALDSITLNKIHIGIPGISHPENALFLPQTRLNFVLSGRKQICLPLKNGITSIMFNEGDVQFSPANTWELQSWDTKSELLCIVQRQNYLRVSHYDIDGKGKTVNRHYHTQQPYPDAFKHIFNAVNCLPSEFNETIFKQLLKTVITYAIEECRKSPLRNESKSDYTFEQIKQYIENSFQEDITRESIAERFAITPCYLSQLFKRKMNQTFTEFLTACRLHFAKHLLTHTNLPIYQIADQVGFQNYVHFVRRFRECCGIPPGKFRYIEHTRTMQ